MNYFVIIEFILITTSTILALILNLHINLLNRVEMLQKILFTTLNLVFISITAMHVYRIIGNPKVYFINLSLNALRESKKHIVTKLFLETSILPSLSLSLYIVAIELTVEFGKNTLFFLVQSSLPILLAYSLYSTTLLFLLIVSRNIVLSSIVTGLTALIVSLYDDSFVNQITLMEKLYFHVVLSNIIIIALLQLLAVIIVSRCRY